MKSGEDAAESGQYFTPGEGVGNAEQYNNFAVA
jgi:hypothetical protein